MNNNIGLTNYNGVFHSCSIPLSNVIPISYSILLTFSLGTPDLIGYCENLSISLNDDNHRIIFEMINLTTNDSASRVQPFYTIFLCI